jgi:hypothetical protein
MIYGVLGKYKILVIKNEKHVKRKNCWMLKFGLKNLGD